MAGMTLWQTYWRALNVLGPEKGLVAALVISNVVVGIVPLGEAYLWGRVVDALTTGTVTSWMIAIWAALGLFGIIRRRDCGGRGRSARPSPAPHRP
jgi:ATP-binding cassette subfamily B protein